MASIASLITDGYGAPGSASLVITMGFAVGLQVLGGYVAGVVSIAPAVNGAASAMPAVRGTLRVRGTE